MAEIKPQLKLNLAQLREHMRMIFPSNHVGLQEVADESEFGMQRLKFRKMCRNVQLDKHRQKRLQVAQQVNYATASLEGGMPLEKHLIGVVGLEEAIRFAALVREAVKQ